MIDSIFKKLSFIETNQLRQYINQEVTKQTTKNNELLREAAEERENIIQNQNKKTWEIIDENIQLAMRENKISQERIYKILQRVLELTKANPGTKLTKLTEQPSIDFEILSKDEYRDLIEELLEGHCKGCNKHNKGCDVYKHLRKHNVAYSGCKGKCKYSYQGGK